MDINRITFFMAHHGINSKQFMILWCLFTDPLYKKYTLENGKTKQILIYGEDDSIFKLKYADDILPEDLILLEEKGFIIDNNQENELFLDCIFLTTLFCDEFFISLDDFEELWEEYPVTINIEGKLLPARSGNYEQLQKTYLQIIKKNKAIHHEIIKIVKKAKDLNIIKIGLEKFITGKHWLTYNEMLNNDSDGTGRVL